MPVRKWRNTTKTRPESPAQSCGLSGPVIGVTIVRWRRTDPCSLGILAHASPVVGRPIRLTGRGSRCTPDCGERSRGGAQPGQHILLDHDPAVVAVLAEPVHDAGEVHAPLPELAEHAFLNGPVILPAVSTRAARDVRL